MKSDEFRRLFTEGKTAAIRGMSFAQNPYKVNTVKWDAWKRGWLMGQQTKNRQADQK